MAVRNLQDPREKKTDFDLQRVDFIWVEKTTDRKELAQALAALIEDGGFPDLQKAVEAKLSEVDPAFRRRVEANNISYETKQAVNEDIASFLSDIQKVDSRLVSGDDEIFRNGKENKSSNNQVEEIEKRKMAENERFKGNEWMKGKEFQEAIKCYSRSLEHYPNDAATFSNRALAYLKQKEFARALEDAESAIRLKDDYIKAYHRRGKAYAALNKLELAIRDFQFILEKEPHNKEAMQEVKSARKKLEEKLAAPAKTAPPKEAPTSQKAEPAPNKFVRVAIQEESDEEEEEKEPVIVTEEKPPKVEVLQSSETPQSTWSWKQSSETLKYDDFKVAPSQEEELARAVEAKARELEEQNKKNEAMIAECERKEAEARRKTEEVEAETRKQKEMIEALEAERKKLEKKVEAVKPAIQ